MMELTLHVEDGALSSVLVPGGGERIVVGRRHAALLVFVPATVRIHGIDTSELCLVPVAVLSRNTHQLIVCPHVKRILKAITSLVKTNTRKTRLI